MASIKMARPARREGSRNGQFRKRIPLDVLEAVRGRVLEIPIGEATVNHAVSPTAEHIVLSLRTADKSEIITRNAAVLAYLENVFTALRCTKPRSLTHRECVGLSGEWYRAWAGEDTAETFASVEPGHPEFSEELWTVLLAKEHKRVENGETQREIAQRVDSFLLGKGARIDANSREMLLRECARARLEGIEAQLRNAQGNYSPDPRAARFPPSPDLNQQATAKGLSLEALFKKWRDHSGAPIYCFAAVTRHRLELNNWDRTHVVLPFGHGAILWSRAIRVARHAGTNELEAARLEVETTLNRLHSRADRIAYSTLVPMGG